VLAHRHTVGKAQRHAELHLVLRLVRPVAAPALRLPEHRLRQRVVPRQLPDIVGNAVCIQELLGVELAGGRLVPQPERDPGVHHRLPLHHILIVVQRHGDIRKHLQIRQPANGGAGPFLVGGQLRAFKLPHDLAPLKVEAVLLPLAVHRDVHIAGGVLGGTGTQAVQAQRELVVLAVLVVVLAAGVQLAEHQLPVVAALFFVPVHRAAPAHILHLHGMIQKAGDGDELAVTAAGLVDGIGQDLKYRVLTALQSVRAKNNTGPLPDPIRALEAGDTLVIVYVFLRHIFPPAYTEPFVFQYFTVFPRSMQVSPDNKRGISPKKEREMKKVTGLHKK